MLNICLEKMTLVADVFLEILAPENMVRSMSKKRCFSGSLHRQEEKWFKKLLQSE